MLLLKILWFISSVLVILVVGYPLFSFLRYKMFQLPEIKSAAFQEPATIIIAGYKEDDYIKSKLNYFLDAEEWIGGSEIIIVVSGATIRTREILNEFVGNKNVRAIVFEEQVPKIRAVNLAVQMARNEYLVFSDCRQKTKNNSLFHLMRNFADPSVGTVVATLKDSEADKKGSVYRRLLTSIAKYDSRTGSALNVYGALYAQRRSLFVPFPEDIIFDDLFVVVSTCVQGYRIIQEEEAVIYDLNFNSYYNSERLQRLARGLLLFLFNQHRLIFKMNIFDLMRFLIFKYLKLLMPFVLLLNICLGVFYIGVNGVWAVLPALGILFVVLILFRKVRRIALFFISINYNFLLMQLKFIFLKQRSTSWEKLGIYQKSE